MKAIYMTAICCFLFLTMGCKKEAKDNKTPNEETKKEFVAKMNAKSGSKVDGTVTFTPLSDGQIMYTVNLTGLDPNGIHAIHIHETGDCSSDDGKSAGGHWNPTGHDHGKLGKGEQFHLGDIGNLDATENGTASLSGTTDKWSSKAGDMNSIIGKAVIVHAKADDFVSQPSGAAGTRIACGVIE